MQRHPRPNARCHCSRSTIYVTVLVPLLYFGPLLLDLLAPFLLYPFHLLPCCTRAILFFLE